MTWQADNPRWWLDEIDLDPAGSPYRMATRSLGDQPWLLCDADFDAELALKQELRASHHDEVFSTVAATEQAASVVGELVESAGIDLVASVQDQHPLERAGLSVQEDLCLLRRRESWWYLEAASLSFPSRWRLGDKIGRPLHEVHEPVAGYSAQLAGRVTSLIDRLGDRIVRRRNWFVHPDPALFQPGRPVDGDPVVPADEALDGLYVRSERQTLRLVDGGGWALFTIRIQQCSVRLLADRRRSSLVAYLTEADANDLAHRGVAGPQMHELRRALNIRLDPQ